jgi:hypothetical protein
MNGFRMLSYPAVGGLTLGGLIVDQVLLVLMGALLVRVLFRRNKAPFDV